MSYVNMKEMLEKARKGKYAVGAFNVVDYSTTQAVILAGEKRNSPVIIQTSVKTVEFYGYSTLVNWVRPLAKQASIPVALHLDHCKDLAILERCIEAGWSSVMLDASHLPLDVNIEMTRKAVQMAKGHNVTVEGEVGSIVGVEDDIFVKDRDAYLADVDSCMKFVEETGVDILAPAIGTAHGLYKKEPKINYSLLKEISDNVDIPLAIHGGTGLTKENFMECIRCGGSKINISTNIKYVFRDSFEEYIKFHPDDYEPIKVVKFIEEQTQRLVESFIDIFGSCGKA